MEPTLLMLGLVLVFIAWCPPDFESPSGLPSDRPVACRSFARPSPCLLSIRLHDDTGDESAPPTDSMPEVATDEIEAGDDFEGFGLALPPLIDFQASSSTIRFHHPSPIVVPPSPEARSPRLRC